MIASPAVERVDIYEQLAPMFKGLYRGLGDCPIPVDRSMGATKTRIRHIYASATISDRFKPEWTHKILTCTLRNHGGDGDGPLTLNVYQKPGEFPIAMVFQTVRVVKDIYPEDAEAFFVGFRNPVTIWLRAKFVRAYCKWRGLR